MGVESTPVNKPVMQKRGDNVDVDAGTQRKGPTAAAGGPTGGSPGDVRLLQRASSLPPLVLSAFLDVTGSRQGFELSL